MNTRMKIGMLSSLSLFLFACTSTPMKITKTNSVETVLLPSANSPTVTFRIAFRTGTADDPKGKEGRACLAASLIAEGGSERYSYKELLEKFYPMAASFDVQCDKELTTFIAEVPAEKLEAFYPLMKDILLTPRFDAQEFARLKENQINYLSKSLRGNNDESLGKWTLQTTLYANHPYGRVDQGNVQSVTQLTLDELKSYVMRYYTRENCLLGIAGAFPPGFAQRVQRDLMLLPESGESGWKTPLPDPVMPTGHQFVFVEKDAPATAVSIGFPLKLTREDEDYWPMLVANSALGEHRTFNGRLMIRMRGLRGLNYGDYSYIENFIQDGGSTFVNPNIPRREQFFSIWIRPVPHDKRLFAIRQAIRELDQFVKNGLTAEEFEQTKKFVLNYSKLWVQTNSRRLGYEMDGKIYGTKSQIEEIQSRVSKLTLEQVNAAIRRHLQSENLWIAAVTKDAKTLAEQIQSGVSSPIQYDTQGTAAEILEEDKQIESYPWNLKAPIVIRPVSEMFEKSEISL